MTQFQRVNCKGEKKAQKLKLAIVAEGWCLFIYLLVICNSFIYIWNVLACFILDVPNIISQPLASPCCLCVLVTQSCLTFWEPMDCSLTGSSVRGILQARILGWVAIPFSRGSSQPRDRTRVSCIAGGFFTS